MLRSLIRFEIAKTLFGPVGLVLGILALATLVAVQQWVIDNPVHAVSSLVLLGLAHRAFRRLR